MKKYALMLAGVAFLAGRPMFADDMKMDKMENTEMKEQAKPAGTEPSTMPQKTKKTKKAKKQMMYHCPMHPNQKSDKPGKCPECGMTMEKMK
jgi:hypothetical protein